MNNFNYQNPTRILFGKGQIAEIANQIPADAKILITYGGGSIKRNGTLDQVHAALEGFTYHEFGGIEPNPTYGTLMKAVELARAEGIDYLLAVGGGSVIDGTKFIAAAIPFKGEDPWTILSERAPIESAVPLGNVLTLPATGSESNSGAVITRRETNDKLAFMNPLVFPTFAVLDPETTFSLPANQTANGVVDAFVHVMEQYLTKCENAPVQDRYAEGLLLTLIEEGPKVLATPDSYEARANVMWAANQALNGLIGQGVSQDWATHMIGHEITALHGLDHGQTLAVVLPSLMNVMRGQKGAKIVQYAERVWNIREGSEDERIDQAIAKTREFFEQMGIPTRLTDYGVAKDGEHTSVVSALVEQLKRHGMVQLGEEGNITPEVSTRILAEAV
ncbi:iron-containing alcohol dehydrogenase [Sansalvadorimonas sp. 2012CJ34-2]|uniref:Iron-containing alcohol dehydrogenase n=1 Tax=Parendozoicomonas callyspongiae TaxID=2942213 RepID=A0ABT0PE56_9GAMM|nr:iron-containing alcohol dehydrogenase [Sansalvadorimonas sp. 2012CJ34-2]MCL6269590.1 iron-containing alcohol dehydrogenase [Sansalvadorimonas sp. 2012CJ34-2]